VKVHLLYRDRDFDLDAPLPATHEDLTRDLDLATVVRAMAGGDRLLAAVASRVLLTSLTDPQDIRYRQEILRDLLAQPDIAREVYTVTVEALEQRRSIWGYSATSRPSLILSGAVDYLQSYVGYLKRLRAIADERHDSVHSAGMASFFRALQEELDDAYFHTVQCHLQRLQFRDGLLLSAELARDNTGRNYLLRTPERDRPGWKQKLGLTERTSYSFTVPPRDDAGGQALDELTNRGTNQVANAVAQAADHIKSYLTALRTELAFYVGCLNLHDRLTEAGQPTCLPDVRPTSEAALRCRDLRDPSLALQSSHPMMVGNDADATGRSLVIVTGANSGGKSTFLRSIGLAQVMAQAGMFVAASDHCASICSGVFTHFIREEDATMRAGRLEEELARMNALVDHIQPGALVLFNESFHSTNEREGSEIARQIVRGLREGGDRVVFVTHQFDFATGFLAEDGVSALFLQARRRADGQRDYHLVPGPPLPSAYGADLYDTVFGEPLPRTAPTGSSRSLEPGWTEP